MSSIEDLYSSDPGLKGHVTNWLIGRVADSTAYKPGTRTPEATGLFGALGNALGLNTGEVARRRNNTIQNTAALDYLDSIGHTPETLDLKSGNLTTAQVREAFNEYKDEKARGVRDEERDYQAGIRQENRTEAAEIRASTERQANNRMIAQLQAQHQQSQANLKANQDQFAFTSRESARQRAHESQESAADRALTRDLSNASDDMKMQLAWMDSDLQDKRMAYDRETRRLDRRDKHIANLMASIGSLGGAFAI